MYENNNYFGYDTNNTNDANSANTVNSANDANTTDNNMTGSDTGSYSVADNASGQDISVNAANNTGNHDYASPGSSYSMNEDGTYRGVYSNAYFDYTTPRSAGAGEHSTAGDRTTSYPTDNHTGNGADHVGGNASYKLSHRQQHHTGKRFLLSST